MHSPPSKSFHVFGTCGSTRRSRCASTGRTGARFSGNRASIGWRKSRAAPWRSRCCLGNAHMHEEAPVRSPAASDADDRAPRSSLLHAGSVVLDRFEVQGWLDAGSMGAVYRAIDRVSGAPVALKVLHRPDLDLE